MAITELKLHIPVLLPHCSGSKGSCAPVRLLALGGHAPSTLAHHFSIFYHKGEYMLTFVLPASQYKWNHPRDIMSRLKLSSSARNHLWHQLIGAWPSGRPPCCGADAASRCSPGVLSSVHAESHISELTCVRDYMKPST